MKFRHKVVTASSFLLLITVSLLSTQQVMTIRSQTQEHIDSSVNEILTSVGNTVQSEMNAKRISLVLLLKLSNLIQVHTTTFRTFLSDQHQKPAFLRLALVMKAMAS